MSIRTRVGANSQN